ncbi:MAG: hypothetical protein ABJI59_05650 [Nisaea sp.]|uniref:hypothetical protein n=1 Tax=Nisaea sp. TaxID=2024842 RepID=UPI00329A0907
MSRSFADMNFGSCEQLLRQEPAALLFPRRRKRLHQGFDGEFRRRAPVEDGLDDVGREEIEAEDAAGVGGADGLGGGEVLDGGVGAGFEKMLPAVGSGEGLDQDTVWAGSEGYRWRAVRRDAGFPAAATLEG